MDDSNYKYTEADVEVALRFLRLSLPKYATPENAIKVLVYSREHLKKVEETNPEEIEKILQDLESR